MAKKAPAKMQEITAAKELFFSNMSRGYRSFRRKSRKGHLKNIFDKKGFYGQKKGSKKGVFMSELLVVASKIKKYIKEKAGMNTAASTLGTLTEVVKKTCDQAIQNAQQDGRKTVMDRDVSNNG